MSLLSCPECQSTVSDRAVACPKCGYPSPGRKTGDTQSQSVENTTRKKVSSPKFLKELDAVIEEFVQHGMTEWDIREKTKPLDIRVGRVIKTRVQIDNDNVAFGRKTIRCQSVVACGWWAQTTANLEWGQGEWTTGWIWLKSKNKKIKITVPGNRNFQAITDKIWTFIGIRLLSEVTNQLDQGNEVKLCGLKMNGKGLQLKKLGFGAETVPWKKIKYSDWEGKLRISSKSDKLRKTSLSFRFTDNVPVLAALLQLNRKHLIRRLTWTQSLSADST